MSLHSRQVEIVDVGRRRVASLVGIDHDGDAGDARRGMAERVFVVRQEIVLDRRPSCERSLTAVLRLTA